MYSALSRHLDAATIVVGTPRAISSAWDGPDKMTMEWSDISSSMTWDKRFWLPLSRPFATLATTVFSPNMLWAALAVSRMAKDGTARITSSAAPSFFQIAG